MSDSNIRQQEHTLLCACFENLCRTFLATIAATPGDFGVVETSTADLLVHLRKALVEGDYVYHVCALPMTISVRPAIKQLSVARLRQPGMLRLRAAYLSGSLQQTIQRKHQQLQEQANGF